MDKKKRILISSLLVALVAGTAIVLAYFSSTDSESILFKLANKYTLEAMMIIESAAYRRNRASIKRETMQLSLMWPKKNL